MPGRPVPAAGVGLGLPSIKSRRSRSRPALTVQTVNRQGITLRLHAGSGLGLKGMLDLVLDALVELDVDGKDLLR